MKQVVMAVVYAVDVLPEEQDDIQQKTFERFEKLLPDIPGAKILFCTPALAPNTENDVDNPDYEVYVWGHLRYLMPIAQVE